MQVHPAVGGHRKNGGRNQATVGHDNAEISANFSETLTDLGGLQRRGLEQLHTGLRGDLGNRGWRHGLATSTAGRRTGDDQGDLVGRREQGTQRRDCCFGGSSENNAHERQFTAPGGLGLRRAPAGSRSF